MKTPMQAVASDDIRVTVEGGRIYARRWAINTGHANERTPIVLLHDSLGCVELWRDFPEQMAQATGHDVIAYDRLGFGKSDPYPGQLEIDFIHKEATTSFQALRDALEIEDFIVFGHSVGGGMAIGCAATYPMDCKAVITESAQTFVEERTLKGILKAKQAFQQPDQLNRLQKYHGDKAAWVLNAWIDTWLAPGFADWNLDEDLRRVQCDVLAIHGDQDEYGSRAHLDRIAHLTAGRVTARLLEGCGHVPHREKRAEVMLLISQWSRE